MPPLVWHVWIIFSLENNPFTELACCISSNDGPYFVDAQIFYIARNAI